jgi:hypothetical protein
MNENPKIDLKGSVEDAVGKTTAELAGFMILLVVVGILFAPIFAPLFENYVDEKYDITHHYDRIPLANANMLKIKRNLWILAIVAWIVLIVVSFFKVSYN